jgi:hypothetical protein
MMTDDAKFALGFQASTDGLSLKVRPVPSVKSAP